MEDRAISYEKVAPQLGDWAPKFKGFIESSDFDDIYKFLKAESREGKVICPFHTDTFRAFLETPWNKVRCIFILQDPYPWVKFDREGRRIYTADGLAMSCRNTGVCQPSLELFYQGMEDDLGYKVPRQPDLTYLAEQGILMLNTSLTVEANKPSSHKGLWDKFISYLIEEVINFYTCGITYVTFGDNAHMMAKAIVPFLHWGFEVEHPAFAARKEREWKHDNIFSKINKILKDSNNEQIIWSYEEYEKYKLDPKGYRRPDRGGISGKRKNVSENY
jgi:uracil-DNA glycosylase